jgi:antitoxin (DNA-binding transcriptional repressor) of toxin-antitoxin stability system
MTKVGSYEAKTHLPELLERVGQGERILITRRGVPVALLTQPPANEATDPSSVVEEMLAYRNRINRTTGKSSFRELIDEGRRS